MFDEMVERIQRTTISVLLKVKVEVRQAPAQPQPAQPVQANQSAQPVRRPVRRMMPVPLSQMSSQQKNEQATENKDENK